MRAGHFCQLLNTQNPQGMITMHFFFSCLNKKIGEEMKNVENFLPMKVCSFDIGEKNMACCELIEIPATKQAKILNWQIFDLSNGKKTKEPVQNVCRRLIAMIDDNLYLRTARRVVIEMQPNTNTRMRIISYALDSVFQTLAKARNYEIVVDFIHAVKKLSLYPNEDQVTLKTNYKLRKKLSVELCKDFLKQHKDEKNLKFLTNCKKADDYSDCYLQGVAYIRGKRSVLAKVKKRTSKK